MNEFERLKKRREAIAKPRFTTIPIPGYGGYLLAKYKVVPWEAVSKIAQRAERADDDPRTILNSQIDMMVIACEGLYTQNGPGQPEALMDDTGQIMKYDKRLSDSMGFEATSAREVVVGLFVEEFMISVHHTKLLEWMQREAIELDEEFVGESEGLRRSETQPSSSPSE
jgi:hypothetical protein